VTLDTLEQFSIPYDELFFGKPHADAYIDHKAINSRVDTEKELGWRATAEKDDGPGVAGGVKARAFNNVRPLDEHHIVKTGPVSVMRGELFWYRQIPTELADLFPEPVEISDDGALLASIVMKKVVGVPFTHLLINLCLTPARLLKALSALTRLHRCEPPKGASSEEVPHSALYTNLGAKLVERYEKHRMLYNSFSLSDLGFSIDELAEPLIEALRRYEVGKRAVQAAYIHGDPVFSNILMGSSGNVHLLDMRGALGDRLTTAGDITYDLAKVFQSLCGYDFLLEDHEITSSMQEHLDSLQRTFWDYVAMHYPEVALSDVRLITAQHFFAIVPLHEVRSRMRQYLRMSHNLMAQDNFFTADQTQMD